MKTLMIVPLFIMGCNIAPKRVEVAIAPTMKTREAIIIDCTNKFIDRSITGKSSYAICKDVYLRKD